MYGIVNLDPWKFIWFRPDKFHIIAGVIYDSGLHYVSTTYIESLVLPLIHELNNYKFENGSRSGKYLIEVE